MRSILTLAILVAATTTAAAENVDITVTGALEFNQISGAPLGTAAPGEPATLSFSVDSDVFVDSASFATRGYEIDTTSFVLTIGAVTMPLQSPFPAGETPYFVIRNDDPGVDGFLVSTNIDFPNGVPLDQEGMFGNFRNDFYVTYTGDTLPSLDILDALGNYDFTGLTVFNWTINDGPFNAAGLIFDEMTIGTATPPIEFLRGDGDGDGTFNGLTDGLHLLNFQFSGGAPPPCFEAGDADGDGAFNGLIDGLWVLSHQFSGGPPPPAPYPSCGPDPDPGTTLGCDAPPCP